MVDAIGSEAFRAFCLVFLCTSGVKLSVWLGFGISMARGGGKKMEGEGEWSRRRSGGVEKGSLSTVRCIIFKKSKALFATMYHGLSGKRLFVTYSSPRGQFTYTRP